MGEARGLQRVRCGAAVSGPKCGERPSSNRTTGHTAILRVLRMQCACSAHAVQGLENAALHPRAPRAAPRMTATPSLPHGYPAP